MAHGLESLIVELDAETIYELSCKSSWDMWEFAVALHTSTLERREAIRERVAEHRKWNKECNRRNAAKLKEYKERNRDVLLARRRERERAARLANPDASRAKERAKWEKRKSKAKAASLPNRFSATVATSGP